MGGAKVGGGYAVNLGEVEVVEALERIEGVALGLAFCFDGLGRVVELVGGLVCGGKMSAMWTRGREELDEPTYMLIGAARHAGAIAYQLPLVISLSRLLMSSTGMGGTVWPLKMVSGTLSSQSSFASALFVATTAALSGTASVEATVASDKSE